MFAGNIGGGDEGKDEGKAGSYRSNGGPVPRGEQEGEARAAGSVRADGATQAVADNGLHMWQAVAAHPAGVGDRTRATQ